MELGGYIEMEHYHLPMLYEDGILLNSGRSCLSYLIKANHITKMAVPYFICDSVTNQCLKDQVEICFYSIDSLFYPIVDSLDKDTWLYLVNYYGQLRASDIKKYYQMTGGRLIVDNAQAYFSQPIEDVNTLYTSRKFFGVTDGAILYSNFKLDEIFPQDCSLDRMTFILGRYESKASDYYSLYQENNKLFANEPIKYMSKITKNILSSIDYTFIRNQRTANFNYLHTHLGMYNLLKLNSVEGAFAYPFLVQDGDKIRKELLKHKIYIPLLWPNVLQHCDTSSLEYHYALNILPLPCDQRYGVDDMNYLVELITRILREQE